MFFNSKMFSLNILLVLFVTKACQAELTCYICDDCQKINENTPVEVCDASYFSSGGQTSSSVMTTEVPTTENPEWETTTTIETTTDERTEEQTTESSEPTTPTPPTVAPPPTTPSLPTPPAVGTVSIQLLKNLTANNETVFETVNSKDELVPTALPSATTPLSNLPVNNKTTLLEPSNNADAKTYMPSSAFRSRQRRAAAEQQPTYHCFTLEKEVNGTTIVSRGCAQVNPNEGVCDKEKDSPTDVCTSCTRPKCNSSSTLKVSLVALVFTLIAVFLRNN